MRTLGISPRSAQVYMQCAAILEERPDLECTSINDFLRIIRAAKRAANRQERAEQRAEHLAATGQDDRRYRLVHADCRAYRWPSTVDVVAADPPWRDLDAYKWLATFAAERLRPGGLVLVQTWPQQLAAVLGVLTPQLQYLHTLAIVYDMPAGVDATAALLGSWCPVLLLSRGPWDRAGLSRVCDTQTVRTARPWVKQLHDWQQPLGPWCHWLAALTRPGELVADPWAGVGTVGVAVKLIGARRYVGTEIDQEHARVARGRLAQTVEGGDF